MPYERDPRVDAYIEALPAWQQAICHEVRDLAHEADPGVVETIKRSVQPYFVLDGNIAALLATRDHVNVFLYDPTVDDPAGIITAGHANQTGRQIAFYQGEAINARRCSPCSARSSPTTGPAAGAASASAGSTRLGR